MFSHFCLGFCWPKERGGNGGGGGGFGGAMQGVTSGDIKRSCSKFFTIVEVGSSNRVLLMSFVLFFIFMSFLFARRFEYLLPEPFASKKELTIGQNFYGGIPLLGIVVKWMPMMGWEGQKDQSGRVFIYQWREVLIAFSQCACLQICAFHQIHQQNMRDITLMGQGTITKTVFEWYRASK